MFSYEGWQLPWNSRGSTSRSRWMCLPLKRLYYSDVENPERKWGLYRVGT